MASVCVNKTEPAIPKNMHNGKFIIRAVQEDDLATICEFATLVGPGFMSLPNDKQVIEEKIKRSCESFANKNALDLQLFFFVLEDVESCRIVGTAAIEVKAACRGFFFNYRVANITQACLTLNKHQKNPVLFLENNYEDASVLGTLFLHKEYRGGGLGKFLSRSRCLFISEFSDLFSEVIIAEMRGIFDENRISPFWESLGRHFVNMDFHSASHMLATKGPQFVADLMPKHPIYVSMLTKEAQAVIGRPQKETIPAYKVLEKEGFVFRNIIDIFDAGPTIETTKQHLKTLRESRTVKVAQCRETLLNTKLMMLSNTIKEDFRATLANLEVHENNECFLDEHTANALNVSIGDTIRICPLN